MLIKNVSRAVPYLLVEFHEKPLLVRSCVLPQPFLGLAFPAFGHAQLLVELVHVDDARCRSLLKELNVNKVHSGIIHGSVYFLGWLPKLGAYVSNA